MTPEDTVCDGCFRRGTSCVSQELPEHPLAPIDRRRQIGSRMGRVETLIEKLVKRAGDGALDPGVSISASNGVASLSAEVLGPSSTAATQPPHTEVVGSSPLIYPARCF